MSDQEKRIMLRKPNAVGNSKGYEQVLAWVLLLVLFGGAIPAAIWSGKMISANGNLLFVLAINLAYAGTFTVLMLVLSYLQLSVKQPVSIRKRKQTVTLAMAAHNEQDVIVDAVNATLKQSQQVEQIIVVNDGSTDQTFVVLQDHFALRPMSQVQGGYQSTTHSNLIVIDKPHGGKAVALNTALGLTITDLFITVDADSILADDAISYMVDGMAADPKVVAAGGMVKAINGYWGDARNGNYVGLPSGMLAKLQWVEYATGFVWRFGWAKLNIQLLLSGSFSGFQTRILRAVGGFDPTSLTEDYEVCYRLHAYCRQQGIDYAIVTLSDALCYTLVPDTLIGYLRQRIRWFQGFLQTLWRYRRYILRPSYGWFGVFALPIKVIDALSPLLAVLAATLIAMAWFDCNSMVLVPAALFLGARWLIEFVYATLLLSLHHVFIQSELKLADKIHAYLLGPVNFMYHTFVWYIYGVVAHIRLWFGVWSWSKNRAAVRTETETRRR